MHEAQLGSLSCHQPDLARLEALQCPSAGIYKPTAAHPSHFCQPWVTVQAEKVNGSPAQLSGYCSLLQGLAVEGIQAAFHMDGSQQVCSQTARPPNLRTDLMSSACTACHQAATPADCPMGTFIHQMHGISSMT